MNYKIHTGLCLDVLKKIDSNSIDAIVTDPPYGISFMGKKWDYDVPSVEEWAECLRVLKPGGHLLAFAGTRTQHRMAVRIEDAGFEIRDMIAWVYGSGFPKSLDVSKAIDKAEGVGNEDRPIIGKNPAYRPNEYDWVGGSGGKTPMRPMFKTGSVTDSARQWEGWGTALKPALEPITVARKPLEGTVAGNVLEYGAGALNIDGCRVEGESGKKWETPRGGIWATDSSAKAQLIDSGVGRWPANLIHDGNEEVVSLFPGEQDSSAARFFYCAKASKADREEGLNDSAVNQRANNHPTVKPTNLMRYLCRLITPPNGTILDPWTGSGSTGKAAILEGFSFIGIEKEPEYVQIANKRIQWAIDNQKDLKDDNGQLSMF